MSSTQATTPDAGHATKLSHRQKLTRLEAEVRALRTQLRTAQRRATVGTMVAMIAHEFNNILTPIINCAQLARQNPALAGKAIDRAADGGRRAYEICNALLGLTEEESQATEVPLGELVSETLLAMARDPRKDAIELSIDVPADLTISAPRVRIQHVVLNLLMNARAAVLDKNGPRRIEVRARRRAGNVFLSVRDNGVGIPPKNLPKIFQPYFSTRRSGKDKPGGHGLGLAVCKEIVEGLGGRIEVESTLGEGATFMVRLPRLPRRSAKA